MWKNSNPIQHLAHYDFFALNAHQIHKMFKSQYSYNIYIMPIFFDCKNI